LRQDGREKTRTLVCSSKGLGKVIRMLRPLFGGGFSGRRGGGRA